MMMGQGASHSQFVPYRHNGWQPAQTGTGQRYRVHIANAVRKVRAIPQKMADFCGSFFWSRPLNIFLNHINGLSCKPDRQLSAETETRLIIRREDRQRRNAAARRAAAQRIINELNAARNVADRLREEMREA